MSIAFDFGERVRRLRIEKGLSQPQVAERIGVSKSVVSNYESNYKLPSTGNLVKLAQLFSTTTDYLLGFDHELVVDLDGLNDHQKNFLKKQVFLWKDELLSANFGTDTTDTNTKPN